jgi:hypothetical protein
VRQSRGADEPELRTGAHRGGLRRLIPAPPGTPSLGLADLVNVFTEATRELEGQRSVTAVRCGHGEVSYVTQSLMAASPQPSFGPSPYTPLMM